ncbi:MAG: SCP2 sterol-binding domain-containing protein [Halopseudomonas yangmingensis]
MLSQALLAAVERSLAAALRRDPLTAHRLGELQGSRLLVKVSDSNLSLLLLPDAEGIQLLAGEHEADCSLHAPASVLLQLLVSREPQALLKHPELQLQGDSQLLVRLQQIVADLRLDGEAELERWVGPVAAHALASPLRDAWHWSRSAGDSQRQTLAEYLTEESRQLVGNNEAEVFARHLHQLQLDLDRLEARLVLLQQDPAEPSET